MGIEKVLLMHGPTLLPFRPPYPDQLFYPNVAYDSRPGIMLMARVFRAIGFKVAFSGWEEDADWLNENEELFDYLVISAQHHLHVESTWFDNIIPNNKEKLYYATLQGLRAIRAGLGDDAVVYRVRADVTVHQGQIALHMAQIRRRSGDIMIEYWDAGKIYSTPDFMLMGEVAVLDAIYTGLYERSRAGTAHHVSSHIDHTLSYLALQEAGVVGRIICMNKDVFNSVVWRGLPRHFMEINPALTENYAFNCEMRIGSGVTVEQLIAQIDPGASGQRKPGPLSIPSAP